MSGLRWAFPCMPTRRPCQERPPLPAHVPCAGGLWGLLAGIKRGAIGVVVLPLASLLDMLAGASDSIRRAVAGSSNVGWVRPPRCVAEGSRERAACGAGGQQVRGPAQHSAQGWAHAAPPSMPRLMGRSALGSHADGRPCRRALLATSQTAA